MSDKPDKTVSQPLLSGAGQRCLLLCLLFCLLFVLCCAQLGAEETQKAPKRSRIEIGSSIEAVLDRDDPVLPEKGRYRSFRLLSKKSEKITIQLESPFFDADLVIRDRDGNPLAEDSLSGPGDGARVVLDAEASKEYEVLAVSAQKEGAGAFKLAVRSGTPERVSKRQDLERDRTWYEGVLGLEIPRHRKREVYDMLAKCHLDLGNGTKAAEAWKKELTILRELGDRPDEARVVGNLGFVYKNLGRLQEALEYYKAALAIHREVSDRERKRAISGELERLVELEKARDNEGITLWEIGNVYGRMRQMEKACDHWEQALTIFREVVNRSGEVKVLWNLGMAYGALGQPEKALECWEQALAIHRAQKDRRKEGVVLKAMGNIYFRRGQPERAREYFEKALAIARELKDRRSEGRALSSLGEINRDLSEFKKARENYENALRVHREVKNRGGEGLVLGHLAWLYTALGEPDKAIALYHEALAILRELGDRGGEGSTLGNLGAAYFDLGRPQKAREYYEQALQIAREVKSAGLEASVRSNLGSVYRTLGEMQKARQYLERGLAIFRSLKDRGGEGNVLGNLGDLYRELGQKKKAIACLEEALATVRKVKDARNESYVLVSLALVETELGEPEKAIDYLEQALALAREASIRRHEAFVLRWLGSLHLEKGSRDVALDHYRRAHAIENAVIEGAERNLEEAAVRSLARKAAQGASRYLEVLSKLYRDAGSKPERDALFGEALELVESLRARTLTSSMRAADYRRLLSPAGKETWDRVHALRSKRSMLTTKLLKGLPREEEARAAALEKLDAARAGLDEEIASIERQLKASEPRLAAILPGRGEIDAASLAGILGEREVLLHYNVIGGKQLVVLAADGKGRTALHTLELDADLGKQIEQALAALVSPRMKEKPTPLPKLKKSLRALGRKLLGGLEKRLENTEGLVVVPDGHLHFLPFEALVLEDGRYLVERYSVRYAASIHVLLELRKRNKTRARTELVLYGDPEFGKAPADPGKKALAMLLRGGEEFERLGHAATEIDRIATLFKKKIVRREAAATEARFKADSPRGAILHVATHGRLAAAHASPTRALVSSGLAFSAVNAGGDGKDDGFLTAAEVAALDLRAVDLAVLSACQTATGLVRGHEGKCGLERSFFVAGVRTYVGSLWRVDDRATSEFMARWYRYLRKGLGKSEALRRVKLDFVAGRLSTRKRRAATRDGDRGLGLKPRRARVLAHPYYWAPFILSGDGAGGLDRRR